MCVRVYVCVCINGSSYLFYGSLLVVFCFRLFLLHASCLGLGLALGLVSSASSAWLRFLSAYSFFLLAAVYLRCAFVYWVCFMSARRSMNFCDGCCYCYCCFAAGAVRPLRQCDSGGESRTESCRPSIVKVFVCYRAIIEVSNSNNKEQEK